MVTRIFCAWATHCYNVIAAGSRQGELVFINAQPGEKILCVVTCGSWVRSIAFKDDMIAAGSDTGEIKIFSPTQFGEWGQIQSQSSLTGHSGVVFSADGQWLISAAQTGQSACGMRNPEPPSCCRYTFP